MITTRSLAPYVAGVVAGTMTFLALRARSDRRRRRLPPGPKPLPILGNLLDMPTSQEWLTWRSYVEKYGDVVYLSALGREFLLLGSQEAITDLIEKRINFNDRPRLTMLHELMDFEWFLAGLPYGEYWRRGRKLLHTHAHAGAAPTYGPIQLRGARRFVLDLLVSEAARSQDKLSDEAKAELPHQIKINFGLTALQMIYGIDLRDLVAQERYLDVAERVVHAIGEAGIPGRFLVDFVSILKYIPSWFPGAQFQRFAKQTQGLHIQLRNDTVELTKAQMAAGTAPVSMAAHMLESAPGEEQLVKDIAGIIYLAGSDTSVSAVEAFFLGVLAYPEVQKRAQEELDRVVGRDRLPEFADKESLPYLDAVMRECLRWLPVLPIGVAHSTTEDDEYRGWFIPKGTLVLPFQWGLLQDPYVYPDPSTFSPEQYLNLLPDGSWQLRTNIQDPRTIAFGFGRRICPGTHLAEQSLFATVSTVLHTLDVVRAKNDDGVEVAPKVEVCSGILSHAKPFAYALKMRSDARELLELCRAAVEQ